MAASGKQSQIPDHIDDALVPTPFPLWQKRQRFARVGVVAPLQGC